MRSLIIGGNRSGKSARGEELIAAAAGSAEVLVVDPGPTSTADAGYADRVAARRAARPEGWRHLETRELAQVLRDNSEAAVLVDDLTAWLTATIDSALGWTGDSAVADTEIDELLAAIEAHRGELVLITSEVGLGVLAATTTGRQFADILGGLNTRVAALCERTEFVVAGKVLGLDPATAPANAPTTSSGGPSATQPTDRSGAPDAQESPRAAGKAATGSAAAAVGGVAAGAAVTDSLGDSGTDAAGAAVQRDRGASDVTKQDRPDNTGEAGAAGDRLGAPAPTRDGEFPGLRDVDHYDKPAGFPRVTAPDRAVHAAAVERQQELTKPAGSLGRLEELSIWYASCRGEPIPPAVEDVRVVVFAGDHGIAEHGVSAYPQDVTVQMVANILSGGAAVSVLSRQYGAQVTVADIAVAGQTSTAAAGHKVQRSCGAIDREDAMSHDVALAAVAAGRRLADEAVDSGADLLIAGDLGIGNTTPAAAITGVICGLEPVVAVGRGTGVDDNGWMRKASAVRDAMFRARDLQRRPVALLETAGGPDFAAMAGFLAQAAVRRTPVLLDGAVVTAAALVADEMAPGARNWWQAGHRSVEPGHTEALKHLGLEPIIDAQMRLGEGSGAVAALPLLQGAVAVLREMATFADAGVSTKDTPAEQS